MNKKKGFLRLTLVLSIIVGILSGVIGYISYEAMNLDLRPLELKPIRLSDIPDTLPTPGFVPDKPTPSFIPDKPTSGFVPDEVIPEWSKVTAGILWLIIGFISVWTIYGFIRWCIINLTTWIIIGFKTSQ